MELIYWQDYDKACEVHFINKIKVVYIPQKLKYIYYYDERESWLALKLIKCDIEWGVFIKKVIINDNEINFVNNFNVQNLKKNKCEFIFDEPNNDVIDEFIWFMCLVRVEIFNYEEDEYFIDKTINARKIVIALMR